MNVEERFFKKMTKSGKLYVRIITCRDVPVERLGVGYGGEFKAASSTQETSRRDVSTVAVRVCPFEPASLGK